MARTTADTFIRATLSTFGLKSFSTKEFVDRFRLDHPARWEMIESEYGQGGKGAGKFYSSFTHVAQTLNALSNAGELEKLDYRAAPKDWGSPVIRYWTIDRQKLGGTFYPDEAGAEFTEGLKTKVLVNRYERDPKARAKCIEHYKLSCVGCDFNFEAAYGDYGAGFIHVHHLLPMHKIGKVYKIDPVKDLRPVCPNCHAMIHYKEPMLTIEALRALLIAATK